MPKASKLKREKTENVKRPRKPPKPRKEKEIDLSDDDFPWGWTYIRDGQNESKKEALRASDRIGDVRSAMTALLTGLQYYVRECDCDCSTELQKIFKRHEEGVEEKLGKVQESVMEIIAHMEMGSRHLKMIKSNA